jgi:hypothetical protein
MMNNQLQDLAAALRYATKWDDYNILAIIRESNTREALLAASELLKPLEKQLLFSMVKNANSGTISGFDVVDEPPTVAKHPMSSQFKIGNTYLINGIQTTVVNVGTHSVTGTNFSNLFTQIKTIELLKELAIA